MEFVDESQNFIQSSEKTEIETDSSNIEMKKQNIIKLREELKWLKLENFESKKQVKELENMIMQYDNQASQLKQLSSIFEDMISKSQFDDKNLKQLPKDMNRAIQAKVNSIFDIVLHEYSSYDINKLEAEWKSLNDLKLSLEKEISILSEISSNESFFDDDQLSIYIDEFETKMSSNDNCSPISYILFSEHIKSPKIYHHYFEQDNTSSSPTYTNIPISDAVSAHESVEKSIYSSQIRFFSQLKNALLRNDKTIEEIPQIDINQSMNEMMSFEIPQQELFNACDPCEVLLSQFQNFYETLQNQNPPNERFNLIKGNFEKELEFPEFVPPPKPQCTIEQITTNNESNKFLHSQLNQMKINASQLNETACNVQKNEIEPNSTTVYEKEENSFSYPIPIGDNEQNDDEVIKNFHDVIKEKGVEISEDFQFDIIEKNEEIDISENTSNEQTNTGIEARMNKLHEILTQQSNISNPKFETVPLIPTTLIKTEKYKTDPILQTINQILIPNQYDTEILSNEIDNLSQRIVDIQNALAAASSEETFDDSELVRCEFEANELMQKVAAEKEKFFLESAQSQITELSEKKKQLQTELSHLEKELSAIDEYTEESITDLEKKYQNAKIEYNTKKQEWEEEQKLRAQLHMGFV